MKNKLIKGSVAGIALLGVALQPISAFADTTDYGIQYSGGVPLSAENVTINDESVQMIDELELVVGSGSIDRIAFSSNGWGRGYMKNYDGTCYGVHYLKVYEGYPVGTNDVWFSITKDNYTQKVRFTNFAFHDVQTSASSALALGIPEYATVDAGGNVFADPECATQLSDIRSLDLRGEGEVFFETNITLDREGLEGFASDNLFFEISDIDNAQSFKILNPSNLFAKSNMFAKSETDLQPHATAKNMYVASGNYIYSPFDPSTVASDDKSNIYVKLTRETQNEGLKLVLGFASGAGSRLSYYAKQFTVNYVSDEHGDITGIETERVISGDTPAGSSSRPHNGYELVYWIANNDVRLTDGTTVPAGQALSMEQIKLVDVESDLTFTAVYAEIPEEEEESEEGSSSILVPNTGQTTGGMNAAIVSISVVGIALGALAIAMIPKFAHKKISFKK